MIFNCNIRTSENFCRHQILASISHHFHLFCTGQSSKLFKHISYFMCPGYQYHYRCASSKSISPLKVHNSVLKLKSIIEYFGHCTMLLELFQNTLLHTPVHAYSRCVTFHQHWVKKGLWARYFFTQPFWVHNGVLKLSHMGWLNIELCFSHYSSTHPYIRLHTLHHVSSVSGKINSMKERLFHQHQMKIFWPHFLNRSTTHTAIFH